MTVEELINELKKIEDKNKMVCFEVEGAFGVYLVNKVLIDDRFNNPVLLKSE